MPIIPVTFWTAKEDLNRLSGQPIMMRDKMFIGLPFKMKDQDNILSRSYIVLPLNRFINMQVKKEAARLNGIITRTVLSNSNRNAGWQKLMDLPEIKHLRQNSQLSEAWTYMLIEIVLRERPLNYLEGNQHLADFLAERLQLDFDKNSRPFLDKYIFQHQVLDRAYLSASLDLKMDVAYEQQRLFDQLERNQIVEESYLEASMVLMGVLSGVAGTGILLLDVLLEAFIAYISFGYDLEKAKEDGFITDQETFGLYISVIGIYLPFVKVFPPGFIKTLIDAAMGISTVTAILLQIVVVLLRAAAALMEYVAADASGFDDYGQYDPENTICFSASS